MLTRIEIQNFRCFRSVDVPLRPLTVLIGANDSGKSNFLAAIAPIDTSRTARSFSSGDFFRLDPTNGPIQIQLQAPSGSVGWNAPKPSSFGPFALKSGDVPPINVMRFLLPSSGIAMESSGVRDSPTINFTFDESGGNVPAFIDLLLRKDRKRFAQYVETIKSLIPGLEDIDVATPDPSTRRLDLVIENGLTIPASSASVGVRMMLFFVALTLHPNPPSVILIEEPENGVHPKRLADIVRLLREITQRKHGGSPTQVILTTHSPYLLDHIDLTQDQVLVFRRDDDGSRTVQPVDEERLHDFLDEYMLGELWFNRSEEGLVAK